RAQTSDPSCAAARDLPCRRLRAGQLPPVRSPRNVHATLHSCSIEPYARGTLNLRNSPNQADTTTNEHEWVRNRIAKLISPDSHTLTETHDVTDSVKPYVVAAEACN